jgi:hypothetical protein
VLSNIYDNPAAHGAEFIGEVSEPDMCWEFNVIAFWSKDGKVYAGQDSGCSCPSPFETFDGIADLTEVRSLDDARRLMDSNSRMLASDKRDMLEKLNGYFRLAA